MKYTEEQMEAIKKHDPEERSDKRKKPVNQYDLEGHYIRTFGSIAEAKRETGASRIQGAVSGACPHRAAGGFLWRYDTGNHEDIPPYHRGKAVLQIDPKTHQLIAVYPSAAEAERKTGIGNSQISLCCNGKIKTTGGYVWRFQEDPAALTSEDKEWPKIRGKQPVNQYDQEGHYLRTYENAEEAKRCTGAPAILMV